MPPDSSPAQPDGRSRALAVELLPEATSRLVRTVDGLDPEALAGPSLLPGWRRAEVVAHLALNAEALTGVLRGVVRGEAVPMYPSQEQRDTAIAELGAATPAELRDRLLGSATELGDAIAAVPVEGWEGTFDRTPGGQVMPLGVVPRMRLLEVELHHVDLARGDGRAEWSPGLGALLVDAMVARRPTSAGLRLHATDLDRTWELGGGGPVVHGTSGDLGWWLSGRGTGEGLTTEDGELPRIEGL